MPSGRGCLEIRESNNPFLVTNNQMCGDMKRGMQAVEFKGSLPYKPTPPSLDPISKKYDMKFLYSRSSSAIGSGLPSAGLSDSKLSHLYADSTQTGKMSDSRRMRSSVTRDQEDAEKYEDVSVEAHYKARNDKHTNSVEQVLSSYNHIPQPQNPLYLTTSALIGDKKPTVATYTSERKSRNQGFSNGFNKIMPRDQGLNTSLTRSNYHLELDPSF